MTLPRLSRLLFAAGMAAACGEAPPRTESASTVPASAAGGPHPSAAPLDSLDWVLGRLAVDVDSLAVVDALGRPDSVSYITNPFDPGIRLERWDYPALTVHYSGGAQVGGLVVHGPGFATRRGIRVGDPSERVMAAYGLPSDTADGRWAYCEPGHDDCLHQMNFQIEHGTVASIFLGWALD
jgi:hypothetical protein